MDPNRVVAYVSLSPDGTRAYASVPKFNALARVALAEMLSEPDTTTEDLLRLGELASAQRIERGDVSGLSTEQWLQRWRQHRPPQPGAD